MTDKPKALVLPAGEALDKVCPPECRSLIEERFDAVWNRADRPFTEEELAERIAEAEIVLSSWGSPRITADLLDKAVKLRCFGYAAGSVKSMIPPEALDRGVKVFSAAPRLALSVAEYCLAVLLSLLRRLPQCDRAARQGLWWEVAGLYPGRELTGQTIGIVSASSTARAFIRLLAPFRPNILVYDPYLSEEKALELGVKRAELAEVMRCPIISIHAPSLPSTVGMIHAELIRAIPNGAILINSSRGAVLDEEALVGELRTGRFLAALDVLRQEPPSPNMPLFGLENVLITPHIAGNTEQGRKALMPEIVDDILRSLRGEPTRYEIDRRAWDILA